MSTEPLALALDLAEMGLACFPCRANKNPATPHGFKDATADTAELRGLWRRHPGPLVGLPTGQRNGFDVLDIDPRHGGDVWFSQERDGLPETRLHRTRSGGLHILFRHRHGVRNSQSKIAPGVDVRGEGGYAIWWPAFGGAVESDAALAEWPDWLLSVLVPPAPAPRPQAAPSRLPAAVTHRRAAAILAASLARLRTAPDGQRHYRLRAAARTLGGLADVAGIGDADAERELLAAVLAAGGAAVDERNATATIRWGLTQGRAMPLSLESRA
jgi:hypothetical protein